MKNIIKNYLGEIIYGGNDGITTTFAVVSGFSGAAIFNENLLKLSIGTVLLFGFANLFSDALSMGVGNYLSKQAENDLQNHKKSRKEAVKTSIATFLSFIAFGILPLIPYILKVEDPKSAFILSLITTFIALLLLGVLKVLIIKKRVFSSILETVLIGGLAAIVAFFVGVFFRI